jgi:AraC-like DNA-binding protein
MQTYRERLPAPGLEDLVACIWEHRVAPDGPAYEHRTVPNGCVEIVVRGGGITVVGPRLEPSVERLEPGSVVVGVRLRPGVRADVLGASAAELAGREVELEAVWGRAAVGRVASRGLEHELAARRDAAPVPDPVAAAAVHHLQPWRDGGVHELAGELYFSPRQLRRRCIAAFGFGPKTLHRILRFQGFLALAHRHDDGLGRLAAAAGYYDQAHLHRECRALAGLTPAVFLAETRASCGANHDHAVTFAPLRRALAMSADSSKPGASAGA